MALGAWVEVLPKLPYREVGFVSRALWALPDGGLVSAMVVWLVVLLWKCQSRLVVFPCVWKRLVVRVSFPCFPLVAQGGGAGRAVGAVFFALWRPLWEACPMFSVRRHRFSVVWLACASIVSVCVSACASAVLGGACAIWCAALSTCVVGAVSCLLQRVLLVSRVVSAVGATVLHLAWFWCLWWHHVLVLEWFVLCRLEPWCTVLYLGWLLVLVLALCVVPYALIVSFVRRFASLLGVRGVELFTSGTLCAGQCLVAVPLSLWGGCFALSRFADVLGCLALPTSDVFPSFVYAFVVSSWDLCLVVGDICFLVGLVRAVPVGLSSSVCVLRAGWCALGELSDVCAQVGRILVAAWAAFVIRFVSRRPAPSRSGGRRLKALAGFPFPFLFLSPFPPPLRGGKLSPLWRLELGGVGGSCGAQKRRRGSEEEVASSSVVVATPGCSILAVRLPADVATAERIATSEKASPRSDATLSRPGWPLVAVAMIVAMVSRRLRRAQQDLFSFAQCSALEGFSARQVVTVTWDPYPRAPVSEGVAPGGGCAQVSDFERRGKQWGQRLSPSHCLTLRWFWSHVGRSGVGPQFDRTAVAPDCGFSNPFLGAVRGGTGVCSSLASWSVRGAGWFCLWTLDLVEVCAEGLLPHCVALARPCLRVVVLL
ncbi:hypothetical protein Taro_029509 [Colocasia esculenta]|uniref:Transmembrane protein n=1 Tax=Colocasia esculenta TaxID=4460 RepID=A0A843VK08_COLES|nr:hypothetical protein [Colocasia esculenta]